MSAIIDELHKQLVKPTNPTSYESVTLDYTPELYREICDAYYDVYQTGWTVCGAQDPAVIYLGDQFGVNHPELAKYGIVRVIDKFLNSWNSATLLEFSNEEMTEKEYEMHEEVMTEEEG